MKLHMANFNRIENGKVDKDTLIADNGQWIVSMFDNDNALYRKQGDVVVTISLEDIGICETANNIDLEPYGFLKIGENLWENKSFKQRLDNNRCMVELK